jgi:hypothetical protein
LAMTGVSLVAQVAHGAQLTQATVTLSNVVSQGNSSYTISFDAASTSNVGRIDFQYANTASGATLPNTLTTTSATLTSININGSPSAGWSLANTTNGFLSLTNSTPVAVTATQPIVIVLGNITNNSTTSGTQCDSVSNSDSCWIQITDFTASNGSTPVDSTTVTYTVITSVSVTATVDPILLFTVSGVTNSNISTNDAHATGTDSGIQTTTSTATALQFGHVTVGVSKVAQQKLQVETNANNGYDVYNKFTGTNAMIGSANSSNNIDPYTGGGATWSSPTAWTTDPTGSAASVDSGWIGVRTTNGGVSGFGGDDLYGPPVVSDSLTGNKVMHSTIPDIGTSGTYVSYKIRVNANQPADAYTGTVVYNVVANY